MIRWIQLLSGIACLLVCIHAEAQSKPTDPVREQAAVEFRRGQENFAKGNYQASALAFEAAAQLVPHASVWLNAAEAWELAGDPLRATDDCDRALATDGISQEEAAEARKRQARFATQLGRLEISGEESILVALDDDRPKNLPLLRWVSPGTHRLVIVEGSSRREMQLDLAAGVHRKIELAKTPATPELQRPNPEQPVPKPKLPVVTEPPPSSLAPPVATWVSYGTAGAAGVVLAIFGGLTVKAADDFNAEPTRENADIFFRDRLITNVALGITAGTATLGTIIWIIDASSGGTSTAVSIQPDASGGSVRVRGSF